MASITRREFIKMGILAIAGSNQLLKTASGGNKGNVNHIQMVDLNAMWYNAVIQGCGLNPDTFQLIQTPQPLGDTSEYIWNIFDTIPPESTNHYYNPTQTNIFSDNYGAVINNLDPQSSDVITEAVNIWNTAGGFIAPKAYNKTLDQLRKSTTKAPSYQFAMNTSNSCDFSMSSTDENHEQMTPYLPLLLLVLGGLDIIFMLLFCDFRLTSMVLFESLSSDGPSAFFTSSKGQPDDKLTKKLVNTPIVIDAQFDNLLTFPAGPLSKKSTLDTTLAKYNPWYLSAALDIAYKNKNAWKKDMGPTWDDTFGENGNMLRCCSGLVVVDGVKITITSNLCDELASFCEAVECCIGSFLGPNASVETRFDGKSASVLINNPKGNPLILGLNITSAPDYFTG